MADCILHFKHPGLLSSIQDQGRWEFQHLGIPIGGAMDKSSMSVANWLVGNEVEQPVLEITLIGPEIIITGPCQIALTGAMLSPQLDRKPISMYKTINIKKKATLSFAQPRTGCRSYLAIGGTWAVKKWLSSYSAASTQATTLTPNSVFQKDSLLTINNPTFIPKRKYKKKKRPAFPNRQSVRIWKGPEFDLFTPKELNFFFGQAFLVSNQSNRMGYRLEHLFPHYKPKPEMISSGIIPGCIQVSNAGQAIILMMDAQTTGGYPRIAVIHRDDLDKVAQLKPGDEILFTLVDSVTSS